MNAKPGSPLMITVVGIVFGFAYLAVFSYVERDGIWTWQNVLILSVFFTLFGLAYFVAYGGNLKKGGYR